MGLRQTAEANRQPSFQVRFAVVFHSPVDRTVERVLDGIAQSELGGDLLFVVQMNEPFDAKLLAEVTDVSRAAAE
jgi:hypothetical protein